MRKPVLTEVRQFAESRGKAPTGQKRLTVNMDADLHKRLKRAAVDSDQTIGAIVERLVREYLGP